MKLPSQRGVTEPTRQGSATSIVWSPAFRRFGVGVNPGLRQRGTPNESGVALVITLIMLSVITFLTVAFLAVSSRDRVSVATTLNQTDSRLMADTALARFQAEMISRMMASSNLLDYDVMLTRNYQRPAGFNSGNTALDTNNVNYDFRQGGGNFTTADAIYNIGNLLFDPRVPVFVQTNSNRNLPLDFRFYLDYNRNGRFETNGIIQVQNDAGQPVLDANGSNIFQIVNGEPEWIGVLQNPELAHGPNNKFIGRYIYFALPVGKTLDLNYIHNYAKGNMGLPGNMLGDGFQRSQGFGSWELNFASLLVDLNTNSYVQNAVTPYRYYPGVSTVNTGDAFNDAVSFLGYRYAGSFGTPNLASIANLFPGGGGALTGITPFQTDFIDGYATSPLLSPPFAFATDPDTNLTSMPWPGSNNRQRYLEPQELFDGAKSSPNFVSKLQLNSAKTNTYDRYTFSRLLDSIGTGSDPELRGKINLNYTNDPALNTINTNFVPWTPVQFFTNVAARLFKDNLHHVLNANGTTNRTYMFNTNDPANLVRDNFSFTNIQIYPVNEYSAPVHRLLQLAANIYDATTTNRFPTVFRPQFGWDANGTNIVSYVAETNSLFITNSLGTGVRDRHAIRTPNDFVWGVPLVVGAKKGFPSFSKFVLQTSAQVSRKLEIVKRNLTDDPPVFLQTNQMLLVGISNVFGLEAWNSYLRAYPGTVRLIVTNHFTMAMTNEVGTVIWPANGTATNHGIAANITGAGWAAAPKTGSYLLPFGTSHFNFLTNSQFYVNAPHFRQNLTNFQRGIGFPSYTWGITMTNKLLCIIIDITDPANQRVVDFVNLDGMTSGIELTKELLGSQIGPGVAGSEPSAVERVWRTNRLGGSSSIAAPTLGIIEQINISLANTPLGDADWTSYNIGGPNGPQKARAIDSFRKFMGFTQISFAQTTTPSFQLAVQTPFNPTRKIDQTAIWQVNDPLVHYTVQDLLDPTNAIVNQVRIPPSGPPPTNQLGLLSARYRPWGGNRDPGTSGSETDEGFNYELRVKDPGVRGSDDWDFPTNKFPNIGWLGRVHRGTPWQTIYLKAGIAAPDDWFSWAGHYDSHPTNDWKLLDIFTTAANDNAARGLLSVNQTNLAAWSAVFGGVVVLSNSLTDAQALNSQNGTPQFESHVIQPNSPELIRIVNDINETRQKNFSGHFQSLGQILAAPSLTFSYNDLDGTYLSSPFLNMVNSNEQRRYGLTDAAVEWMPRQVLSLLKLGEPRFVVYCYGQSLKPANNSLVLNPPDKRLFNICTNYQITGEVVTRTILRVEGDVKNPKSVIESYNVLPAD